MPLHRSVVLRLVRHEAEVHAVPGREVRDLGDALLLHDAADAEPFWNRVAGVRFPKDNGAFDRRLAELGVLFATLARQPHIWLLPPYDEPADLHARLIANGFEDAGPGHLMAATDDAACRTALDRPFPEGVSVTTHSGLGGSEADAVATAIVGVLLSAFGVGEERRPGVIAETLASLADPRFTHYLVRADGRPASVARRATFDGVSYLSSVGTVAAARGRGLGRLVTAAATVDAFAAGSELVHLGVFWENRPARALYESLRFSYVGDAGPDMILTG